MDGQFSNLMKPNLEDNLSKILSTDKQKAFLRNRLAGMNKRQAAIHAGYSPATASVIASRLTNKLACNVAFIEEMHRQGLSIEAIVGEIKRGMTSAMHAQHPDQPDNYNRRAYADMAVRIYGGYSPTKIDVEERKTENVTVTLRTIMMAEKASGEKFYDEAGNPLIKGDESEEDLDRVEVVLGRLGPPR